MPASRTPTKPSAWSLPSSLLRYALALITVGLAVLFVMALGRVAAVNDTRPALLVAIVVSALYGGLGPGLLAVALAAFVSRDPVFLASGALLSAVCGGFRKPVPRAGPAPEPVQQEEASPAGTSTTRSAPPPLEVTTEATWRFHHEQPLDITLPEDEQIEHIYLYSVLAECNDAFARMYGFRAASDVVGTRLVVFLSPSNQNNVDYLRRFIRSGYRLEDAESQEIDRYGHAKYFVNNLVGIFERGRLVGAWGTQRDVTEQRRAVKSQEYNSRLHSSKSSSQ